MKRILTSLLLVIGAAGIASTAPNFVVTCGVAADKPAALQDGVPRSFAPA